MICLKRRCLIKPTEIALLLAASLLAACANPPIQKAPTPTPPPPPMTIHEVAVAYVKLVLALGERDANYVDAYYGPTEWRDEAHKQAAALPDIEERAQQLIGDLDAATPDPGAAEEPALLALRKHYLKNQLGALSARARILQGLKLPFDDEARALFDVDPPHYSEADFELALQRLDHLVPAGPGTLADRYNRYLERFAVPKERLQAVMQTAIEAARAQAGAHIPLPPGEHFELSLVTGKPWSAYNWYQGKYLSRIEVNTDLPVDLNRTIGLASHEGYPGHHVYNLLLERDMVNARGAVEFTVYPLFSPQSFIAEGSADYGVTLAFPEAGRLALEHKLFAAAGFDARKVANYDRITQAAHALGGATIEAARRYLDGTANADQTVAWLQQYGLASAPRARQRIAFFDTYRSYIVNYAYGEELVRGYVQRHAGRGGGEWAVFSELLSHPHVPGDLLN